MWLRSRCWGNLVIFTCTITPREITTEADDRLVLSCKTHPRTTAHLVACIRVCKFNRNKSEHLAVHVFINAQCQSGAV